MKTDELIRILAADQRTLAWPVHLLVALAVALGCALSLAYFSLRIGVRPDLSLVADDARFIFKFVVTLTLAGAATGILLRMIRPGASLGVWPWVALLAPLLLALGVVYELMVSEPDRWERLVVGRNSMLCLRTIPILSAPILVALLIAMKRGAPANATLAGATAGLLAGGLGAAFYAAHCPDDSPLFVATWYGISIVLVTIVAAGIGSRVLRW